MQTVSCCSRRGSHKARPDQRAPRCIRYPTASGSLRRTSQGEAVNSNVNLCQPTSAIQLSSVPEFVQPANQKLSDAPV